VLSSWTLPCLTALALLRAPADGDQEKGVALTPDARLIAAVQTAAAKGLAPGKVEATVGKRAALNTFRKDDSWTFTRADIAPDPNQKPPMPDRKTLRWVAYWVRPVESHNPRIIGIAWPKKGRPKVFFGEVLPPG